MKLSIALTAVIVAFVGSVSAAPTPDSALAKRGYPNCNSVTAYKNLNFPSGYAVLTGYDNNAADIPASISQGNSIADCVTACNSIADCTNTVYSPAGPNWGFCYPKNFRYTAFNVYPNGDRIFAARGKCADLAAASKIPADATCCNS